MSLKNLWYPTDKVFIDGQWQAPSSGETLDLFNPSTGAVLAKIARGNADDIDRAAAAANAALSGPWSRLSAAERGRLMMRLSNLIHERVDDLAIIEAHDVGKPLKQARADALAMARYFEFYGGAADKVMGETIPYLGWIYRLYHA
jgi:aldehyde dehydrogenase (NAD+)